MVLNLNRLSFSKYGEILPQYAPEECFPASLPLEQQSLTVKKNAVTGYCLPQAQVCLDFVEGMTLLAVSPDAQAFEVFYLDKPVCLRPGVYFAIMPYMEQCSVRGMWPADAAVESYTGWQMPQELRMSCGLSVRNIYTLFYQEKERGFLFKGEAHRALELTYVDRGALHNVVEGVDWFLQQGELIIFGENQWHMQYSDMDTAVNFITISFDMDCTYPEQLINRKFSADPQLTALLREILQEQEVGDRYSVDMILCKLQQLLLILLRQGSEQRRLQTPSAVNNENELINGALSFIAAKVYEKISVGSVAEFVGISPSYLSALFHKRLQISPGEYIRRTRLEESKNLIREGKENISQIAQRLNYSTVNHFSRQFKEKFGITPTEYAKTVR